MADETLLRFPTDFPIKIMGEASDEFRSLAVGIVTRHFGTLDASRIEERPSSGGKYLGLTITVRVTSREQLDELYRTLSTHPMVKVVL